MEAEFRSAPGSLVLVHGPARGGKSRWAETLLKDVTPVTYVATASSRPEDASWQERLRLHRSRRPHHWALLEAGPDLPADLKRVPENDAVLIDALGGYVAQHLDSENDTWERQTEALLSQISFMKQTCVVVIEETGWGVVPSTAIGGLFRDRLGALAQRLDRQAVASWLVVQGRALDLHALGVPVP